MKLPTPRPACFFASSAEEAGQLLLFLHAHGLTGIADGHIRPRITVGGVSQERLNELCWEFARRCFEARAAREARESVREGADLR